LYKAWRDEHKLTEAQLPTPTDEARLTAPAGRSRRCRDAQAAGTDKLDEEAAQLAEARASKSTWLAPAIIISLDTAVRQDELVSLTWDDVFTGVAKPYIHLRAAITKGAKGERGGKERTVPLSRRAVEAFRELKAVNEAEVAAWNAEHPDRPRKLSPKPIPVATPRAVGHAWDTMIEGARARAVEGGMKPEEAAATVFPDLKWHDLRHEGISRWFERTSWSEMRISTMAGHSSLETTRIYTHLRGQDVEVEADDLTDEPGTVKLTDEGEILVMTVKGEWVPVAQAKPLIRAHVEEIVLAAAARLTGAEVVAG
jgi:integrase